MRSVDGIDAVEMFACHCCCLRSHARSNLLILSRSPLPACVLYQLVTGPLGHCAGSESSEPGWQDAIDGELSDSEHQTAATAATALLAGTVQHRPRSAAARARGRSLASDLDASDAEADAHMQMQEGGQAGPLAVEAETGRHSPSSSGTLQGCRTAGPLGVSAQPQPPAFGSAEQCQDLAHLLSLRGSWVLAQLDWLRQMHAWAHRWAVESLEAGDGPGGATCAHSRAHNAAVAKLYAALLHSLKQAGEAAAELCQRQTAQARGPCTGSWQMVNVSCDGVSSLEGWLEEVHQRARFTQVTAPPLWQCNASSAFHTWCGKESCWAGPRPWVSCGVHSLGGATVETSILRCSSQLCSFGFLYLCV